MASLCVIHRRPLIATVFPYTTLFRSANTFTEATASFPNTSAHLNALGNDVMSSVSSVDQRSATGTDRSEEHTSELQSRRDLVCRLLLEKKTHRWPAPTPPSATQFATP